MLNVCIKTLTCVPPLCTELFERQTSRRKAACRSWKKRGINPPKKMVARKNRQRGLASYSPKSNSGEVGVQNEKRYLSTNLFGIPT
jgi:hypothetical protein